jgi:hypothetical protein
MSLRPTMSFGFGGRIAECAGFGSRVSHIGKTPISGFNLADEGGCRRHQEMARALVMVEIARIVAESNAAKVGLELGALELRLATDEIFHLGEATVTRVA